MLIKDGPQDRDDINIMDEESFEYLRALSDNQLKEIARGGVEDSDFAKIMLRARRKLRGELK